MCCRHVSQGVILDVLFVGSQNASGQPNLVAYFYPYGGLITQMIVLQVSAATCFAAGVIGVAKDESGQPNLAYLYPSSGLITQMIALQVRTARCYILWGAAAAAAAAALVPSCFPKKASRQPNLA
jgi:hypothetical protein